MWKLKIVAFIISLLILSPSILGKDNYYNYNQENFKKAPIFNEIIDAEKPDLNRINAIVFYFTNYERLKKGLKELTYHPNLEESSFIHSTSMVKHDYFDHLNKKSKKLKTPNDRARFAGITNPYISENIIEAFILQYKAGDEVYPGQKGIFRYKPNEEPIQPHSYLSLGEELIRAWMDSPHHRENILSKKALQLGCGTAFFLKTDFNDMPTIITTQNFQQFESVLIRD